MAATTVSSARLKGLIVNMRTRYRMHVIIAMVMRNVPTSEKRSSKDERMMRRYISMTSQR